MLLDPTKRPVIGHRGNRAHAPENTLESLAQAVACGAEAIEFDLHRARDGVPVVLHDPTLERTTDASGEVRVRTAAELARVDAGARFTADGGRTFPYRGRGIGVPTLEQVLAQHPGHPMVIEMKTVEVAVPALAVLERAGALGHVLIGSFIDEALLPFARAGVPVCGAPNALARLYLPALLGATPRELPYDSMCIPRTHRGLPIPVRQFARVMRAHGRTVHVWTVNDREVARRLWARGVNGIISDDPAAMLLERGGPA